MAAVPADRVTLVRGDLAGFPRPVQNALLAAYRAGANYRITDGTHILLFGTLEGKPGSIKVSGSRKAEDSVRFIDKWMEANFPAKTTPKRKLTMVTTPTDGLRELPSGFRVFVTKRGTENNKIATNGTVYLCRVCGESMETAVGASAHVRKAHEEENQNRSRENKVERSSIEFTDTPAKPEDYLPPLPEVEVFPEPPLTEILSSGMDPRVEQALELIRSVVLDDTKAQIDDLEKRNSELQARLDECETRLALVRESLGM